MKSESFFQLNPAYIATVVKEWLQIASHAMQIIFHAWWDDHTFLKSENIRNYGI
jgi:hypothetical protein